MKRGGDKERLVVIGNGISGVACVEEVLKLDPERYSITVFGAEKAGAYNRVLLSSVLTGDKSIGDIALHDKAWYEANGIRLHSGVRVTGIRRPAKTVIGEGGEGGIEEPYDRLVIATGSVPLVPGIPGVEREGVAFLRDASDCDKIRALISSSKGKRAVVMGGGLLGLEAAYGLRRLGAEVTVVHLAERLMERQLDGKAAELLKADIERLGIEVLLGKEAVEISGDSADDGKAGAVVLKDGGTIGTDLVLISIGIRPNISLAKEAGIYCRKGIVVSDTMQTYDPSVYAVGECVEHRGETFGLVGPVFEQARVLASHLAGDSRLVFRSRPQSMRLKVPGIELFSAGDPTGDDSIEYMDRALSVYKRISIRDGRLSGILMYGDTLDGPALYQTLLEGKDVSGMRKGLLFGGPKGRGAESSIEDMPDETIVCGCNGVTKAKILEAITRGALTREDIKRETKASGSCGGCSSTVERILEATLGAAYRGERTRALCACTTYSREDVLKNIRERDLRTVGEVMETLGWVSVGCDTCRPAINYYLSMARPASYVDDPASRLINERTHANIQKDGTFSVVPRVCGGVIRADELRRIADAADKYSVPLIKITGGQRIGLIGVRREDLPDIWKDIDMPSGYAYGKALRTVKTCVGSAYCRYGTQDSLSLGIEIEKYLSGLWTPAKLKLSVSGCPRNCSEASIKDIGIMGVAGGFEVYAGGCGGIELKGGELLAALKTSEEVKEVVYAFVQLYREDAEYGERTFKWIGRKGIEAIKKAVVEDLPGRKALISRLAESLDGKKDPWAERVSKGRGMESREPLSVNL